MKLATAFTLFLFFRFVLTIETGRNTKHYIVYMGDHSLPNSESIIAANHDMLAQLTGIDSSDGAHKAAVYHYTKTFGGFSAMLTPEQALELTEHESVISVFESKTNHPYTTRSWDFLGLTNSVGMYNEVIADLKSDVIVGMLDTGVWPESESFKDKGLGPVPKRFNGECVAGDNFTSANYNRKLIGARFYNRGFEAEYGRLEYFNSPFFISARDTDGHGTHTASTVAGSVVSNVSLLGIAPGNARGGIPGARLSIYKLCWFDLCSEADILMAFDDAVNDAVDIISISLGPDPPQPNFFHDPISIGSFHAFRRGILVSASAGNSGLPDTAINVAPWILTAAASTVDREFTSILRLGNSKELKGKSVNPLKMEKYYEIILASAAAAAGVPVKDASFCTENTLNPALIKGKIVVCATEKITDIRLEKAVFVRQAGGVGMVLIDELEKDICFQYVIPTTVIDQGDVTELLAYLATHKNPVGIIYPTTTVFDIEPAPEMAVLSSMGPNIITPEIIKPDVTAPGINILAAWSPLATATAGERSVHYNMISGTSMACPHISAIAAIVKSRNPGWSPSAIKSAIMTTATVLDNSHKLIVRDPFDSQTTPFDYGSGQVNLIAALDPGLVYDYNTENIIDFLCSNGAGPAELKNLTGVPQVCKNHPAPSYNLNYPSIGVSRMNGSVSVTRTVTYTGSGPTVYQAFVESPKGVKSFCETLPAQVCRTGGEDELSELISCRI